MAKAELTVRVIDSGGAVPAAATGPGGGGGGPLLPGRGTSQRPSTGQFVTGPGGGGPSSLKGVAGGIAQRIPGASRISGLISGASGAAGGGAAAAGGAGAAGAGGAGAALGASAAGGPIGLAVGTVVVGTLAAGAALKKFADNAEAEARRLSRFSGELALATAQSDIRRELADLRRARRIGPAAARFETRRSRLETEFFDLVTEIKASIFQILEQFAPLIELLGTVLEGVTGIVRFLNESGLLPVFLEFTNIVIARLLSMARWIEFIAKWFGFDGAKDEDLRDPFFETFNTMVQQGANAGPDEAPVAVVPDNVIGPALGGNVETLAERNARRVERLLARETL